MLKKILFSLFIVSFISMAFAEEPASPDIKVTQRVAKDKNSYNASLEITKNYTLENEVAYWETFLKAEPDHVYAPEIKQRMAELKTKLPPQTQVAPQAAPKDEKKFKVGKGTIRANVDTGFSYGRTMISDLSTDVITVGASIDYFIIDYLTLGPSLLITYQNSSLGGLGDESTTTLFIGASIGTSACLSGRFVPFLKIIPGLGYLDLGSSFSLKKFALGLEGGLDVIIVDHVAVGLAVRYDRIFSDPGINVIGIPIRFAIYF